MLDNDKIGNQISLLRKEKGLTGEKLAELLDISPQAISKWENGKCLPETALLPGLAKALGCSVDALLVPKELLILEAIYSNGLTSMDVTSIVNNLVYDNKLNICVNTQFISVSIGSDRLKVLTIKYQTPNGSYYAFALQNEMLVIDISTGVTNDTTFKIIGAYYGNEKEYNSAMQKMEHYEYFKWDAIHVNHETFPSNTGSDDVEYLSLIYLNKSGIHCISCAENDTLYYADNRTSLYLKDTSCCILPDIIRLNWEEGMDCPWAGALYASLEFMGEKYTYEQIMGLSGACYRVCFVDVWDWSCTDALVSFDYSSVFFKAIGYEQVWAERLEKGVRKAERQFIVKDIQNGKPVIAINLRVAPEWGVITGYLNNGNEFLCRIYFDKGIFEEHDYDKDFLKDTGGYLSNDYWPFLITHFGEKTQAPSAYDNLIASLKSLVDSFNAQQNRGYHQGKDAYESWIRGLSHEADFTNFNDKDSVFRRLGVNDSMLLCLIDARRCAGAYLRENVCLLSGDSQNLLIKIANNFDIITKTLSDFRFKIKFDDKIEITYNMIKANGVSTSELRQEQIVLLQDILKLEQDNMEYTKQIIGGSL